MQTVEMIDIQVPYTTWPRMQRNTGPIFNSRPSQQYKTEKLKQLDLYGDDLWAEDSRSDIHIIINQAAKFCGLNNKDNIVDLALSLEEDIAILDRGKLIAICFCFPSSWIPRERIGLSLTDIHVPVADSEKLVKASTKLAATMADPVLGSFKRSVWTVTNNPSLTNHPKNKLNTIPQSIDELYFRTETQTTAPLGNGSTSLFFVKVDVVPLTQVWNQYGIKIVDSINSMSENILEYKNLNHIKKLLNIFVRERSSEPQFA